MVEIERKYLVKDDSYKMLAQKAGLIVQGYLGDNPLSETRVAIRDNHGWLFVKDKNTLKRYEWCQEIPLREAIDLLQLCPNVVRKLRYIVSHEGRKWEVDEFLGDNAGLVIAECELLHEDVVPELPDFVGEEVTEDTKYYNCNLASNPYLNWDDDSE